MDTKKYKTIGILGGMGAAASADLYARIVRIAQTNYSAQQDSDFPEMWIYNLSLTDFDETGFVNKDSVLNQLVAGVTKLSGTGSDFIVIPCNTVHFFYHEMQATISIPIVSIIDTVADAVVQAKHNTIGIISSKSTREMGLYEQAMSARGVSVVSVNDEEQEHVDAIILRVIGGSQDQSDINEMKRIAERLTSSGAQGVVLGCTELPLAISQKDTRIPLFSSTELLAEAALRNAYS